MDESHLAPLPQRARATALNRPSKSARVEPSTGSSAGFSTVAMVTPRNIVQIDGSILEGGGQIVRICTALSALLGTPIRLDKIRAGRSKGGLAAQHAAGLNLVGRICGATLEGASVGSSTVTMRPGRLADGGHFTADAETAGATMLMLQSALPCCCFSAQGTNGDVASRTTPTTLVLKGGTNVPFAPQYEYMEHVTLATMRRVLGLDIAMALTRRGCFPRGGGEVTVEVGALRGPLPCFEILERGRVVRIFGRVWASGRVAVQSVFRDVDDACQHALGAHPALKSVPISLEPASASSSGGGSDGCGVVLWALTSTGCVLGASALLDKKATAPAAPQQVAAEAVRELAQELAHGGCVDAHLQDQLIVMMALAQGTSKLRAGPLTLHTETAMYMCGLLTGATFSVTKEAAEVTSAEEEGGGGLSRSGEGGGEAGSQRVVIECQGIGYCKRP